MVPTSSENISAKSEYTIGRIVRFIESVEV